MQRTALPAIILLSVSGAVAFLWAARTADAPRSVERKNDEVSSTRGAAAVDVRGPTLAFVTDELLELEVGYRAETRAAPLGAGRGATGGSVSGAASFTGVLSLHTLSTRDDGGARLVLRVERCDAATVRVLDRDLLAGAQDCAGALTGELLVDVDARGGVGGVGAAGGAPTIGTRVMEALALELFAPLPDTVDVDVELRDTTPRGAHAVTVRATPVQGGFDVVMRADAPLEDARLPADEAQVTAHVALALRGGRLTTLRSDEQITGAGVDAKTHLEARVTAVRSAPPRNELLAQRLGEVFQTSEEAQARALSEQRIAGLTAPEVMSAASVVSAGGEVPGGSRFLWRATALLRQDPALARALSDAAADPAVSTRGRAFCLDLLAQAGSAEAEQALLDALQSDAAKSDRHHAVHVQRLSLLEHPSRASVDATLAALRNERSPAIRGAWLASAGSLSATIDDDDARAALHGALRDAVRGAGNRGTSSGDEQLQAALLGIGNSTSPELAEDAVPFLNNDDAGIRAVAVQAVSDAHHPKAAALLGIAARDDASLVQRVALRALDQRFTSEGVTAVAKAVEERALRHDNVRVALEVLKHHARQDDAEAQAALELIAQDDAIAAEERAAARSLALALTRGAWAR